MSAHLKAKSGCYYCRGAGGGGKPQHSGEHMVGVKDRMEILFGNQCRLYASHILPASLDEVQRWYNDEPLDTYDQTKVEFLREI